MKKLNLLLFIAATSLFISCDKDDAENDIIIDGTLIVGEWDLVGYEVKDGRSNTEFQGETIEASFSSYGKDFDVVATFSENPNIVTTEGSYTTVIETTVLGQTQTQTVPGEEFNLSGEWSLEGNKLITFVNDEEAITEIISLTEEEMIMQTALNESIEQQGIRVSTSGTIIQKLKRR